MCSLSWKPPDRCWCCIGGRVGAGSARRAKRRFARAAQHYEITVTTDPEGKCLTAITWVKTILPGSAAAHPGVYCLRTPLLDNATLWRTCIRLIELRSVLRSLKTDLGLRPVFHHIDHRVEGNPFISVLAKHFVHTRACNSRPRASTPDGTRCDRR